MQKPAHTRIFPAAAGLLALILTAAAILLLAAPAGSAPPGSAQPGSPDARLAGSEAGTPQPGFQLQSAALSGLQPLWVRLLPDGSGSQVRLGMPGSAGALASLPGEIVQSAVLSLAGERLALVSEAEGGRTLWVLELTVKPSLTRIDTAWDIYDLSWSPDGELLAYQRSEKALLELTGKNGQPSLVTGEKASLQIIAAADGAKVQSFALSPSARRRLLGWSADGAGVLAWDESAAKESEKLAVYSTQGSRRAETGWQLSPGALLAPDGRQALVAREAGLVWISETGAERLVSEVGHGFSAAWGAGFQPLVLRWSEDEDAYLVLQLDPESGSKVEIARLNPPGFWRLLGQSPDGRWLALEHTSLGTYLLDTGSQSMTRLGDVGETLAFGGWIDAGKVTAALETGAVANLPVIAYAYAVTSTATITVTLTPTPTITPTPSPTPTCPATSCSQPRFYDYQPDKDSLQPIFIQAAQNGLGSDAPVYDTIYSGLPPAMTKVPVDAERPIPHLLLRGVAWQESLWTQYGQVRTTDPVTDFSDERYACTLLSFDCGYGMMQITSCMSDGCGWFNPTRVSRDLRYNLGTGAAFLVVKWNDIDIFLGQNDPTHPSDWYYALIAYNGFGSTNDPNREDKDPRRVPYLDVQDYEYSGKGYTYQERVTGWLAHPEYASGMDDYGWRPNRVPEVPRGMFGLSDDPVVPWGPPDYTPRPLVHLFRDITLQEGQTASLTITNTTNTTEALDILLYNLDGSFNRRWLDPTPEGPWFVVPYIRIAGGQTRTIDLGEVFPGEFFYGYARVVATAGLSLALEQQTPPPPERPLDGLLPFYLPGALRNSSFAQEIVCTQAVSNGGFEELRLGVPVSWTLSSSGGYALADSTWFHSQHTGAYLGGYNGASEAISQTVTIPAEALEASLRLFFDVQTKEGSGALAVDTLQLQILDENGAVLVELAALSNLDSPGEWQELSYDLLAYAGQTVTLRFQAATNESLSSSFFVDDVSLQVCALEN